MPEITTLEQRRASVEILVSWARTQAPETTTDKEIAEMIFKEIFPEPAEPTGLAERLIRIVNEETHASSLKLIQEVAADYEQQKNILFDALLATTAFCDLVARLIKSARTLGELANMLEPHLPQSKAAQELRDAAFSLNGLKKEKEKE